MTGAEPGTAIELSKAGRGSTGGGRRSRARSCFRDVEPGGGYTVVAGDCTVGAAARPATRRAPAAVVLRGSRRCNRVPVPHDARRHPARGRTSRCPGRRGGPVPDGRRVLGLRPGEPRRQPGRVATRADARLRDGRRQHARHGLLRRRVAVLRAAAGARRLRRDRGRRRAAVGAARQGRHGRHLLPGHHASCSSPRRGRRTSPRSRRCRSSPTRTAASSTRAASSTPASRCRGPRTAQTMPSPRPTAGSAGRASASRTATTTCAANQALRLQTPDVLDRDPSRLATTCAALDAGHAEQFVDRHRRARRSSRARGRTSRPAATCRHDRRLLPRRPAQGAR